MPQGKGTAQWRSARPGTCDGLPRGGLHFGANLSSGAPSDARVFAALFLLPEYRWPAANRTFPGTAGRPTNRRRHGVCRSSLDRKSVVSGKGVSVRVDLGGPRNIKKKKTHSNT